jgi:RNA methyltransferase, TrmH family
MTEVEAAIPPAVVYTTPAAASTATASTPEGTGIAVMRVRMAPSTASRPPLALLVALSTAISPKSALAGPLMVAAILSVAPLTTMTPVASLFCPAASRAAPDYDDAMVADGHGVAGLEITSPSNPRIKQLVALRRRRSRDEAAITLVEGLAEVRLALAAGARPRALYYCPDLASPASLSLADDAAAAGTEVIRVSRPVFEKVSYREGPDGWLAVVPAVEASLDHLDVPPWPLVLICAGLEKPGNLGAILRTADAAGVAAVIAADPVTDWGNPNVIRASKGTVFSVPVASGTTTAALEWLARHEIRIVAASPDATLVVTDADLTGPVAIAVGAEQAGLDARWLSAAGDRVRIPMFGRADSLNVSTSAAIITYEAVRQRTRS